MVKRILLLLMVVMVAMLAMNLELVLYGMNQAQGQLKVILNARDINEVLEDENIDQQLKIKIILMQEIREFAIDSLGLNDSNNYTSLYDQKGEDILWNLSASEPFELKSHRWYFPILGSFSYKGFFDLEKAKQEREELKNAGLDTRIRSVSAWSTLGWFDDPILSKMLKRDEGYLADLVIHELTHSTIFVRDSITLNENLASFIGEQGARRFLKSKYGPDSPQFMEYILAEDDYRQFSEHMLAGASFLDSLFTTFDDSDSDSLKLRLKTTSIQKIVDHVDTITFADSSRYKGLFRNQLPNNAYFMGYHRYNSKIGKFEQEFNNDFKGDLKAYISYLKERYGK